MESIRRLIAWILILCFTLQNPIYTLADSAGSGRPTDVVWRPSSGGGGSPSAATFQSYGYKTTITNPKDKLADVQPLGDTYTIEELEQQFANMDESTGKTYYEPGSNGIHAYATGVGRGSRFSTDYTGEIDDSSRVINFQMGTKDCKWMEVGNPLAWALYEGESVAGSPFLYNEELAYLFTADGASACGSPEAWINEVNRLYDTIQVNTQGYTGQYHDQLVLRSPLAVFMGLFEHLGGQNVAAKFKHITWSTNIDALYGASGEDPYVKALSARLGLVGLDALMCLVALRAGNDYTLNEMVEKTYAWITSDYAAENMAMVMVESTHSVNVNCDTDGDADFITLLDQMAITFQSQNILMGNWPEDCYNSTEKALVWCTNGATVPDGWRGPFNQATVGYPNGGTWIAYNDTCYAGRAYLRTLYPTGSGELFGYFINWAYDAVCGSSSSSSSKNSMGSFTWQLNPDGVNDKTPSEEINASSTIYNLNIAQDGYNDNNYTTDWVPTVRQDGVDGNKLRIRIHHISENLTEDQQATEYARDAVKKQGKPVTTEITKVIPGDGTISGIPKIGIRKNRRKLRWKKILYTKN